MRSKLSVYGAYSAECRNVNIRRISFVKAVLLALAALTMIRAVPCASQASDPRGFKDALDARSAELVGPQGVDCGRVHPREDAKKTTECGLAAQAAGQAFRIRYDLQGIDSAVAVGIVRTSAGEVLALFFDGDPMGGGGVSPLRQRVSVRPCPKPVHLWVDRSGRISCFQQQSASPANIMSPTPDSSYAPQAPVTVVQGQTVDEVTAALGPPKSVLKLETKEIYVYQDMQITFKGGKVSDVQQYRRGR